MSAILFHIVFVLVNVGICQGQSQQTPAVEQDSQDVFELTYQQLMNASSINEILNRGLLKFHGRNLTAEDLGMVVDNTTGKLQVSAGSPDFGLADRCAPREVSVSVELAAGPESRIFPRCVRAMRCGGCCGTQNVACEPFYKERRVYNMLEVKYDGSEVDFVAQRPVEIEQHLQCQCRCLLSVEKCGPLKNFHPTRCACTCKRDQRCSPPFMFSPETCGCVCADRQQCCTPGSNCLLSFNEQTCECDFNRNLVSSGSNHSQADVEAYRASQQAIRQHTASGGQQTYLQPEPPAPSAPPAPTTTSVPPTVPDPCRGISCPPGLTHRIRNGSCRCAPTSRRRGGRRWRPTAL